MPPLDSRSEASIGGEGDGNAIAKHLPFGEMLASIVKRIETWREGPFVDDVTLVLAEVFK